MKDTHIHASARLAGFSAFLLTMAAAGCSSNGATGQLSVHLTDAPGPYDQVHVTISELSAHVAGGGNGESAPAAGKGNAAGGGSESDPSGDGGWVTISVPPTTIDLLTLQNGVELPLGTSSVPVGTYDMLRLVVTSADVVVAGNVSPLSIPSGSQRGIQVKYDFTVGTNDHAQLLLDFNAAESIHQEGNGGYSMVPVLSVKNFAHGG